jgi:hypothetical protein
MINSETIKEFQKIAKEEYGQELEYDQAATMVRDLVGYFDTLAKTDARIKSEKKSG